MLAKLRVILIVGAVGVGLVATNATATDVEEQMKEMRDMVLQMQDQLEAQQDRLDAQSVTIREAGLDEDRGASSGLSSFLESTDFSGWVSTSYTYNANSSGSNASLGGQNVGNGANAGLVAPLHQNNDSFQLDQLWFRMDKAPTEESRAGFHTDITFGEVAKQSSFSAGNGSGNDVAVYSAYVSYLAPIGEEGIQLDAGKLWTMIGAEVIATGENFNITRGLVWALQPVNNTGVVASTNIAGFDLAFGFLNDVTGGSDQDVDHNKTITARAGWSNDMFGVATTVNYGSATTDPFGPGGAGCLDGVAGSKCFDDNRADVTIIDTVVTYDPTENLSFWANYDFIHSKVRDGNGFLGATPVTDTHAFAVAGRWQATEDLGVSTRWELVDIDADGPGVPKGTFYSLTGTLDYALTENLTARGEARYDWSANFAKDKFANVGGGDKGSQLLLLAELIYNF